MALIHLLTLNAFLLPEVIIALAYPVLLRGMTFGTPMITKAQDLEAHKQH